MSQYQECGARVLGCSSTVDRRGDSSFEGPGHSGENESYAAPRTILFVDDEPSLLEARRLMFEFMGYSVLTAASGEEALEVLQSDAVDAVVIDFEMPGMDGEETAREIRRLRKELPIILSSGCLSLPAHVFETVSASVHKTMRPQVLFDILEQQLHPLPAAKCVHEIAIELSRSIPA